VDLVFTHDHDRHRAPVGPDQFDLRPEPDPVQVLGEVVHHHHAFHAPREEPESAVDLPKAPLAVDVLRVFRSVALGGGKGHFIHHAGAFHVQELLQLRPQRFPAGL